MCRASLTAELAWRHASLTAELARRHASLTAELARRLAVTSTAHHRCARSVSRVRDCQPVPLLLVSSVLEAVIFQSFDLSSDRSLTVARGVVDCLTDCCMVAVVRRRRAERSWRRCRWSRRVMVVVAPATLHSATTAARCRCRCRCTSPRWSRRTSSSVNWCNAPSTTVSQDSYDDDAVQPASPRQPPARAAAAPRPRRQRYQRVYYD